MADCDRALKRIELLKRVRAFQALSGATSNSPIVAAFFNLAPYALLGVIGSIIVRRARLQAQTLLG